MVAANEREKQIDRQREIEAETETESERAQESEGGREKTRPVLLQERQPRPPSLDETKKMEEEASSLQMIWGFLRTLLYLVIYDSG